jgi:predicted amidophosphoribosyltransferase
MLAAAIAGESAKAVNAYALKRVKSTRQQVGLTASERDENVRGAFLVARADRPAIEGRRVLLVDDVYTTGATVKAATRALLRAGAGAVDVLVFARVVRGVE